MSKRSARMREIARQVKRQWSGKISPSGSGWREIPGDVLVDLRRGSPTYGQWEGSVDEEQMNIVYASASFGHGFCVVPEVADVIYVQDAYYDPTTETEFRCGDPAVDI